MNEMAAISLDAENALVMRLELEPDAAEITLVAHMPGAASATLGLVSIEGGRARTLRAMLRPGASQGDTWQVTAPVDGIPRAPGAVESAFMVSMGSGQDPTGVYAVLAPGPVLESTLAAIALARASAPGPGHLPLGSWLRLRCRATFTPSDWPGWPVNTMIPDTFCRQALEVPECGALVAVGGSTDDYAGRTPNAVCAQRGDLAVVARPSRIMVPDAPPLFLLELPELTGRNADYLQLSWGSGSEARRLSCAVRRVKPEEPVHLTVPKPVDCQVRVTVGWQVKLERVVPANRG